MLELGWIAGEQQATQYLQSLLLGTLPGLDLAILRRLWAGWAGRDLSQVGYWSQILLAARESSELQAQERQMARALERVLIEIMPSAIAGRRPITFAEAFAAAGVAFGLQQAATCVGYAFAWCESHVSAVAKLLPLGPISAQRLLHALLTIVPEALQRSQTIQDDDVGAAAPGLALACAFHETQYSRLFRS